MRWIGYVATILWWSGIARSLSTLNRGHSYKISPKPCKVPGSESKEGTCMFVWECIKSEGTHVGVCVDTFMFGSCCVHNTTVNTISASHHSHRQQQQQQHGDTTTGTLRPILFGSAVSNETTRLTTSTSSLSSWSIGSSTTKPNLHQLSGSHGSTRPLKPYPHGAARPLQKRPHAKPTSEHDVDRLQTLAVSVSASSLNTWTEDRPQETKRPGGHHSHHQKTRPDEGATSEKPLFVQSQPDFKDKLETHNTLIVRLPGKEHADNEVAGSSKPAKPGKPNNLRPFESRPDDGKTGDIDLSVQETINRPNVNSVIENETAKEPHPNLNFIHIERPHWATKPAQSKPSSTDFPKPFFSVKTTTYRPISISGQADQRPNFISKPNVWTLSTKTSTTTTTKPTYVKQPSTSRIHTTNFSLASNYRTGLRHKTETIVALTVIPVVVLVNFVIFIILVSVVIVIIVIITQTNDRDYCIGDCTNTIFKYEFSFLVKQLDAT